MMYVILGMFLMALCVGAGIADMSGLPYPTLTQVILNTILVGLGILVGHMMEKERME
jgi:hypothetical protein